MAWHDGQKFVVWKEFASRGFEPERVGDLSGLFFERVYRKGLGFRWEGAFTSYLKAILVNLARDELRRLRRLRRREVQLDETLESAAPSPEEHLLDREGQEALHRLLARLAPLDRHIVLGSLVEGRSGRELARTLGLSRDAVYQRLRRLLSDPSVSDRPDLSGPGKGT